MHGGEVVADVLRSHHVPFLFTLCGGHISPILSASKARGIRVIDVRHEATAIFAADAVSRLTGIPGVAVVTAGPGVTNTITAVKNAQLAQSPLVLIGGAAATILRGRGALQDIDQLALLKSCVKWQTRVRRVKQLGRAIEEAFFKAKQGVPGPVFVECPVDLLYEENLVREMYGMQAERGSGLQSRFLRWYLGRHIEKLFGNVDWVHTPAVKRPRPVRISEEKIKKVSRALAAANKPLLLIGSQAMLNPAEAGRLAEAVQRLGVPVYLSGMARGLLGKDSPLQLRHQRRKALREADLVLLAGVPNDFRLDYGRHIRGSAALISVNRSRTDLVKNRRPDIGVLGDPGAFLNLLAETGLSAGKWGEWLATLRDRDRERESQIEEMSRETGEFLNPLRFFRQMENHIEDQSVLVADGGDFVASASYILRPRSPLSWLDPGVYGTLGVGAGFAIGAKLARPDADVWLIYGDGAAGFSLMEFDTLVRHQLPLIAVLGNDGGWAQIAREQVEILGDDVATVLNRSNYHEVAAALGGCGTLLRSEKETDATLAAAKNAARKGKPALINVWLNKSDFRKGSISM